MKCHAPSLIHLLLLFLQFRLWAILSSPIVSEPIILGWNSFFGPKNVIRIIAPTEQVKWCRKRCKYSEDLNDSHAAAAIVFHANGAISPLPEGRRAEQLYVMFDLESPANSNPASPSRDFFNLTMTYLGDDEHNLHAPYGGIHRVNRSRKEDLEDMWTEKEVVLERVRRKNTLALQIASNCAPQSGRDVYIRELRKLVNITGYGRCFGRNCNRKCYDREIDKHFFYLAFENSVCRNYVTEKFWNAFRHLTVPVVLSRPMLKGLDIPPEAFIAADDFKTVEEMAKFLTELSRDEQRYLGYLNWTRWARRKSDVDPARRAICRLCELAHQKLAPGSKVIADIGKYWRKGGQCRPGFAGQFVPKTADDERRSGGNGTTKGQGPPPMGPPRPNSMRMRQPENMGPAQIRQPENMSTAQIRQPENMSTAQIRRKENVGPVHIQRPENGSPTTRMPRSFFGDKSKEGLLAILLVPVTAMALFLIFLRHLLHCPFQISLRRTLHIQLGNGRLTSNVV